MNQNSLVMLLKKYMSVIRIHYKKQNDNIRKCTIRTNLINNHDIHKNPAKCKINISVHYQ